MLTRVLTITGVVVAVTGTVVAAAGFADSRMTVLKVDADGGRFQCVEHRRWASIAKADLAGVAAGDIVRVTSHQGKPARLIVVRSAAEEISSPER